MSLDTALTRFRYVARQAPRVAWYLGHGLATRQLHRRAARQSPGLDHAGNPEQGAPTSLPATPMLMRALADLFARDLANVEAGLYPMPAGTDGSLAAMLARSRAYFDDLGNIHRRRQEGRHQEAADIAEFAHLPRYFRQNFHYQSGGYLSDGSAAIYDTQVEVLFSGAANAMRRQVLVPVADYLHGRRQKDVVLADIACGTGVLLNFLRQAFPRLKVSGVDLSLPYLAEARRRNRGQRAINYLQANAERLPFADDSVDLLTSVYLFHELPPKVRVVVAREFARVLKPGGRLIFMDSLQHGDRPELDGLLDRFPAGFHEPYYAGYIRENLDALFGAGGLAPVSHETVFVSKCSVFEKR